LSIKLLIVIAILLGVARDRVDRHVLRTLSRLCF
jgi:hypothetical protein